MNFKVIAAGLIILLLTACSTIDIEKVVSDADKAFEAKDLVAFSENIQKLKDGNSKEYETYIAKIKENDAFDIDSYQDLSSLKEGLNYVTNVSLQVPLLKDYATEQKESFSNRVGYYSVLSKSVNNILSYHVKTVGYLLSKSNTSVILMFELQDVDDAVNELNTLSSDANSEIIALESQNAPEKLTTQHNAYIESLKKYKSALDTKSTYISSKKPQITSSNRLLKEGNIFAIDELNNMNEDLQALSSDVETALKDVQQRVENLQSYIK